METKKDIKTYKQKHKESIELSKQIDDFLRKGGKIEQVGKHNGTSKN